MFVSFLAVRLLRPKLHVFVSTAVMLLVSFLSVGLPLSQSGASSIRPDGSVEHANGIVVGERLPLSYPFYVTVNRTFWPNYWSAYRTDIDVYRIHFFWMQFPQSPSRTVVLQNSTLAEPEPLVYFNMDWGDYLLYYTFFFSLNLVGAIIGYWTGKSRLLTMLQNKMAPTSRNIAKVMSENLQKTRLNYFIISYLALTTLDIAQTMIGFPENEIGAIARIFIIYLRGFAWLYFPFRVGLTILIVFLAQRMLSPAISKKLFLLLSLMTLAATIWNAYSLMTLPP